MSSTAISYNPEPPRFWSRVENSCVYPPPNNLTDYTVFIPLTKQNVSPLQAQYEEQMLQKGNVLQYKNNSANLTKKQKYSQIAKGLGNSRKKCYASQTQTYTNPNTSSLLRVNYKSIPFPNEIVGSPNNTSGPFQINLEQPFNCPTNVLQDGGNLVCNQIVNPCTGQVIQTYKNPICYPTTCSDVPGTPIDLCWPNIQSWYPKQRYKMNNSGNKWPYNYKGLVSAVTPTPPVLALLSFNTTSIEISWAINVCKLLPITSFNIYVNNNLFTNILNNNLFTTTLTNLNENDTIYITSLSNTIQSKPSNIIYVTSNVSGGNNNGNGNGNGNENGNINPDVNSLSFINKLMNDNTIVQINTFMVTYIGMNNPNSKAGYNDSAIMTSETYDVLNIKLTMLSHTINSYQDSYTKTYLQNMISHYKDILNCLKYAFDKHALHDEMMITSQQWQNDSITLRNVTLLQEYIKKLNFNNKMGILGSFEFNVPLVSFKPEYLEYIKLYGHPSDGRFDPELLLQIMEKMNIVLL